MGELLRIDGANGPAKPKRAVDVPLTLVKCGDEETFETNWPWIRGRIAIIEKKVKKTDQWTARHFRYAILGGMMGQNTTELWLALDTSSNLHGFAVTTIRADPYRNLPVSMVVQIAWGNETLIDKLLPELEAIARKREFEAIEFATHRKGWLRIISRRGFFFNHMVFRKEL